METLKESYVKEIRTQRDFLFNGSDYQLLRSFTINNKNYKAYLSTKNIDDQWDNFVLTVKGSCFQQLSGWVDYKKPEGWDFVRIIYIKENLIVGGYQLLIKKMYPFVIIGYINHGPVLNINDSEFVKALLEDFEKITKQKNLLLTVVNPYFTLSELSDELSIRYLKNTIFNVIHTEAELDISVDEKVLMKNLLRMRKQNIKKGENYDFKVVEGNENDLERFFYLMKETCKRNNVKPNPPSIESLKIIWQYYHPRNLLRLYNFIIDQDLVSSILAFEYQDTFIPWKFGWLGNKSSQRPNDVFHWELIKIAKRKGFTKYNFGGINSTTAENFLSREKKLSPMELKSSTFFKMGFGCYIKKLPDSVVYIPNPILKLFYKFYQIFKVEKTKFRKMLKINLPAHIFIYIFFLFTNHFS